MSRQQKTDRTILVVEDERPLSEAVRLKLEGSGYSVATAQTVPQALDYLREIKNIEGVWLDHYLLGKEDGLDLVVKMKTEGSGWEHIPVFVVSNTASSEKVQTYIQLGVKKYYVKANHRLSDIIEDITRAINTKGDE